MSLGKLPVFKNLVPGSHSKRRLKPELTSDMISSPLGDFRHTMHVGRGGDVFGDTSFLSDHGGEKAREGAKSNLLVRALRNVRKSPMRNSSREVSPPPVVSPIIKNAVSLPHLLEIKNGSVERLNFKTVMSSPEVMDGSYGLESGFCTLPRWSRLDKPKDTLAKVDSAKPSEDLELVDLELPRTDSLLSFSVDLGPSLMSEVLAVMEPENQMEKESPRAPENGARLVKFHLDGPSDQRNGAAHHNGHEESPGEVAGPGVGRAFGGDPPLGGFWRQYQRATGQERQLSKEEVGTERPSLWHCRGPSDERTGEYWGVPRSPSETARAQDGSPSVAQFVSTSPQELRPRWGSLPDDEGDARMRASWRPLRPRVPADGEEAEQGYSERCWESRLPATESTGFNPLKAEAFAFADEDEEIRV
ncbi:cdc42 effector protein 1-like [Pristis pectinata]|uniref:cdc42 effector protein 1-like n=1 Tax=Pristis pectinata TaxID=685728 RepID=UPI00223D7EA2|nr:cdc42 effector protein 1-like [Pristis pectinata]